MSKVQEVWLREEATLENAPLVWKFSVKGLSKVVLYKKGRVELHWNQIQYFQHSLDPNFPMNLMVGEKSTAGKLSHFVPYKLLVMNWVPVGWFAPVYWTRWFFFVRGEVERYNLQPRKFRFWTQTWRSLVIYSRWFSFLVGSFSASSRLFFGGVWQIVTTLFLGVFHLPTVLVEKFRTFFFFECTWGIWWFVLVNFWVILLDVALNDSQAQPIICIYRLL